MRYLLLSTGCLSIAWLFFKALLDKKTHIKTIRYYFLIAIFVSLAVPLSPLTISPFFGATGTGTAAALNSPLSGGNTSIAGPSARHIDQYDLNNILVCLYLSISFFFLIRTAKGLYSLLACYRRSGKEKWNNLLIVWNHQYKASFSFFHLVFLNRDHLQQDELDKVLAHEKVHATQYHSIDLLLMQFLTAFMWFNPLVWAMRNSIQLIHEYLADEGVLHAGIDKVQYQQSLLNQVAGSKLVPVSSAFNQSLLRKRFLMMSAAKAPPATKYKMLLLIPAGTLMFLGASCVNGLSVTESKKVVTAVALTNLNVVYIGIDNPVNISVSGYPASEISVAIDNGAIEGSSGEYLIKPARPGKAIVAVSAGGKVVRETELRVKLLPDPVVALAPTRGSSRLIKGGDITRKALLKAGGIIATVENADIDVPLKIASFNLSVITSGHVQTAAAASDGDRFSPAQLNLIASLSNDQKIIFDNITTNRPDGSIRKMPASMVFTIIPR